MSYQIRSDFQTYLKLLMVVFFAVLIEQTIINNFLGNWASLHLLPLFILFLAFYWNSIPALIVCAILGIFRDFIPALLIGPAIAAASLTYFCFSTFAAQLYIKSIVVQLITGFCACLMFLYIESAYYYLFSNIEINYLKIFKDTLFTACITPLAIPMLKKYFVVENNL